MKMRCRCKVCCPIIIIVVVFSALISGALYVFFTNKGGEEIIHALDSLVIENGLSSYWCREVFIESKDNAVSFNATVLSGQPEFNPSIRQKSTIQMTLPVAHGGNVLLRYFLPATSVINIMQCADQPNLMSYIFKGHDLIDECIKLVTFTLGNERLSNFSKGHDPCNDIILGRELVLVCRGSRMQPLKASIAIADYYLIYYTNPKSDDAQLTMKMTLDRPSYDLSNKKTSCTEVTNCTLPLTWGRSETVLLQTGVNVSPKVEGYPVSYKCQSNYVAYIIIFIGIPLIFTFIIVLVCFICIRRKRKQSRGDDDSSVQPILQSEPVEAERTYTKEDEYLQHSPRNYGTFDPINAILNPVPGSSFLPSAPTVPPFISDNDLVPFLSREPPPTYEDSMKDDNVEYPRPMKC